jgi:natural product precursor
MKNLKINKLTDNRLNEKEIRALIGGVTNYEWTFACPIEGGTCCDALCSCTFQIPFSDPTSSTSIDSAVEAQKPCA